MKQAWRIYTNDLRHLTTNWAAATLALGLIVLPSLYAWINVEASIDPYAHTEDLPVGVVNEDRGAELAGRRFHAGDEIVKALKHNHQLGWRFVTQKKGIEGVRKGDYFATIVIPADFSAKLATVVQKRPKRAVIYYYENDKRNAIAPKITERGASTLSAQVSDEFARTVNTALFSLFHQAGVTLEQQLPAIRRVEAFVFRLENELPTIQRQLKALNRDVEEARSLVHTARELLPAAKATVQRGLEWTDRVETLFMQVNASSHLWEKPVEMVVHALYSVAEQPPQSLDTLEKQARWAALIQQAATDVNPLVQQVSRTLRTWEGAIDSSSLQPVQRTISRIEQTLASIQETAALVKQHPTDVEEKITHLREQMALLDAQTQQLDQAYRQRLLPMLRAKWNQTGEQVRQAKQTLLHMNQALHEAEQWLSNTDRDLAAAQQSLKTALAQYPFLARQVRELAAFLATIKKETNIDELIRLLKQDPQAKGAFLAHPIDVKTFRLFPLPNYGSGMNPFYTVLAIWVGCLLLVSVLSTDSSSFSDANERERYAGRLLTFWTLNALQAMVVTAGAAFFLPNIFVREPGWFMAFGLLCSFVFMAVVFSLVSLFGNVGKAMAIVLLVLQIAGAGGTYPIELIPPFFQQLNPWLPFTYAIDIMREAVGGIVWERVEHDVKRLLLFAVSALLAGLVLKGPLSPWMRVLKEKAALSGLFH
ncbi:phage infection protein [Geobacillus thermocatenulatus]|uniref:Phage infection protein n=1 Tax=Geobacillus thermocatenulatus TaxID=33938 RepID=A0A226Q2R3_9BACL|nr:MULTISPECIES: YhgE/Pip domain-containing protein [Geobacillus]ASS99520.1 phage infection protein [Geobacillus thermocatenulatus]KLR73006.1 phage infection protein [Geobacillus sp. T6]OXB85922.1 phage infection protein [Geobacillus thermocatenulatus]